MIGGYVFVVMCGYLGVPDMGEDTRVVGMCGVQGSGSGFSLARWGGSGYESARKNGNSMSRYSLFFCVCVGGGGG